MYTHRIAIITAVFVGLIAVAPSVLAPISLQSEYRGVQLLPFSDDVRYRARIHDVLDGHVFLSSPYLYEYKNGPVVMPPLNEWLYALPAYFFGLSAVIIAAKFFLPAALFFLVYLLALGMVGEKKHALGLLTAITAGLAVTLGSDLVDYNHVLGLISGTSPPNPLVWTRLVNPITGGVQLFGFLLLLWYMWQRKYRYAYVAAGVLLASMVGYFFTFGLSLAMIAALSCAALLRREYDIVRNAVYVLIISVALDAWYWYHTLLSVSGEAGRVLAMRNGMSFTHAPILNKAILAATVFVAASFAYAYVKKEWREHERGWIFLWAAVLSGWIVFNQQIVTGREIWYQHFAQYTVPLGIVLCVVALFFLLRDRAPRFLVCMLVAISVVSGAYGISTTIYKHRIPELAHLQGYAPVIEWLNENAPKDCVVLDGKRNEELVLLISAYTACNTYMTTSTFFGITPERIDHNFLLRMRLEGVMSESALTYLYAHEDDVRNTYFSDWNQLFSHGEEPWIVDHIAVLEKNYRAFAGGNLEKQIRAYRANYIVFKHPISPALRRELPSLTLATTTENFYIYTF
ncbi:hypothetical protein A3C86_01525 [Candidatus Kaiserbacteria bacterium RIFCSPHIGHO2_02_FULL_49_16]|uniref:Glycosyltransferase RgtA/B/C/D-like domain-containing protein n=1 Tax=Candidatus Kaiserbacteria bacterium RIFCSPHIGHO2_02_FULL_49_16 TaxID=1798490 RepID=A0A1F6DCZ4_9BACT|nr:MAG: hypothetical protein A3C86_01525 [Candidatus Kaiserbacteria bacterium RIFCSPHIGHO2_02_FULL_49_16]